MKAAPIAANPKLRADFNPGGALLGLSLTMFMASLDTSIANSGLPTMAKAFGIPFSTAQWIVLSYLLSLTVFVVSVGRLGDLLGRRRLLLVGLGLFTASSLACGLAPNLFILLAARGLQGLGAAVMVAITLAFAGGQQRHKAGAAMGIMGTMSAAGTALGPTIGGILTTSFGWGTIFLINVPVGLIALYLARRLPPDEVRSGPGRFDFIGTLLLGAALAAYSLSMTLSKGRSWSALNLALLTAAAVFGLVFALQQGRARSPLVRIRMLADAGVGSGLAMSLLVSSVLMTTLVVGPFFLSRGLQLNPLQVGLVLSIGPAVVILLGVPAGRLTDLYGPQLITRYGLFSLLSGTALMVWLPIVLGLVGYIAAIIPIAAGYALFQTSNNTFVMQDRPEAQRGAVSGILNLSRNLGLITGASLMGAVYSWSSGSSGSASMAGHGLQTTFALAAGLALVAMAFAQSVSRAASLQQTEAPHLKSV